jgi:hypothetical protein
MGLSVAYGQFASGTSSGDLAEVTVGFAPKVVILKATRRTATEQGVQISVSYGATDGTRQWAVNGMSKSSPGATTVARSVLRSVQCVYILDVDAIVYVGLALAATPFTATGFVLNAATAPDASIIIDYLCLGGTDLAVYVGTHDFDAGAAGTDTAVTAPNFLPTGLLLACPRYTATVNSIANSFGLSVGWTDGINFASLTGFSENNVAATNNGTMLSTTKVLASVSGTAVNMSAVWKSFDATGFTLTRDVGTSETPFGYVAFSGIQVDVGTTVTKSDGTGTWDVTTAFTPLALLVQSGQATGAETTPSADLDFTFGGAISSSARGAIWAGEVDALDTDAGDGMTNQERQDATKVLSHYDNATAFAAIGEVQFSAFGVNKFTLDQTDQDAAAHLVNWIVFGAAAAAASAPLLLHEGYDVGC